MTLQPRPTFTRAAINQSLTVLSDSSFKGQPNMKLILSSISCFLISGCTSTVQITSQPEGAYITRHDGLGAGFAPLTYPVVIDETKATKTAKGCWWTKGITVQWASGATISYSALELCSGTTDTYFFNVVRPQDVPNLHVDLNFAMQMRAQGAARAAALFGAISAGVSASQPANPSQSSNIYNLPGGRTMNCSTLGNVTNCY